jgi:hypothetical protein
MTKDKMDLIWGIEQMEKELAKNHSPASQCPRIEIRGMGEQDKEDAYKWNYQINDIN